MTAQTHPRSVAAPWVTATLAVLFILVALAQAAFADGFAGGHHMWLSWHENVGDLLVVLPLASLIVGLVRRRQADTTAMLASRVTLVVLVVAVIATGHAGGRLARLPHPGRRSHRRARYPPGPDRVPGRAGSISIQQAPAQEGTRVVTSTAATGQLPAPAPLLHPAAWAGSGRGATTAAGSCCSAGSPE